MKNGLTTSSDFLDDLLRSSNIAVDQKSISRQEFTRLLADVVAKENRPLGIDLKGPKQRGIALSQK